jgi:hypothetical protein
MHTARLRLKWPFAKKAVRYKRHCMAPPHGGEAGCNLHRKMCNRNVTHIASLKVHNCVKDIYNKVNRIEEQYPKVRLRFMFHYCLFPNRRLKP